MQPSPSSSSVHNNGENTDIDNNPEKERLEARPAQLSVTEQTAVVQETQAHDTGEISGSTTRRKVYEILKWFIIDQWFLLVFALLILISSQVQVPPNRQHTKRIVISYLAVAIIFFINGCTLSTRILVENYFRWRIHLFVQIQCFLVASAATFAIVSLCAINPDFMDPWLLIGLLFLGTVPTTMSSNVVMTRQAHGNTALTVVQSTLGQFLCPFLTPVLLQMYLSSGAWYTKVLVSDDNYNEIYRRVFKQLGLSLFVPMFVGQSVRNLFPQITETIFIKWKMVKLSSIALLVLIWSTFDQAFGSGAFAEIKTSNIVFLVFMNVAMYFVWLGICFASSIIWLAKKDVIACCYCCPAKALTMLVPLSSVMYVNISPNDQSKLQIPVILFQAFQVAIGGFLTIIFRRWIKPEEDEEKRQKEFEAGQRQSA
ncbi:sodium bile acid symporter family protein [Lophiostoma macrostomum CBS 122681]|uniref:Sodium bile acid symporter family protein n=1 Tax=Lophiostoma macrostomum CBS 122681 TaxID=1314788 RepID=A0A6A6T2N0_9PLEO|nr:sodium bile acid symporter family protein [Lophiostoma macrostomum CBS 122681]